jgi:hypothetical protein
LSLFFEDKHKFVRLALVACHIPQRNQISLGIPESGPIRANRSRMLRERRKQCPTGYVFLWLSIINLKLRKRESMEIVKDIRALAFVAAFIATALAPRIISAFRAARKSS